MKIGVLGGTFNPIHAGHLRAARAYADRLGLDRVLLIPTCIPPHKEVTQLVDAQDRLAMCRLAVQEDARLSVCDYEIQQTGRSYTYKTLQYLHEQTPSAVLYLLMGADMFLTVQNWRQPEEVFRHAVLCAAQRQPGEREALEAHRCRLEACGARCIVIGLEPLTVSSTAVRERLQAGQDVSDWLHPAVLAYIQGKKLYQK